MKHLKALLILPVLLAGCASQQSPDPEGTAKPPTVKTSEKAKAPESVPITKEDFEKIPKNLRPEELEQRDDTTVVIRAGESKTVKEYRINGFLYGIQVIPKIGKPYYLVAADHQGNFTRLDKPGILIPSWTIFEWK